MTYLNKHVARKMEQQYQKKVKHFFVHIQELNQQLHALLLKVEPHLDKEKYAPITDYIEQYVVHTTIWRLRFTNNLQNIEIAVLQVMLLEEIYKKEQQLVQPEDRQNLDDYTVLLLSLNNHAQKLFEIHQEKLHKYIQLKA